ncbi:hypothetical protein HK096_004566, partial [Nowakowskiella sp. JEL0078]
MDFIKPEEHPIEFCASQLEYLDEDFNSSLQFPAVFPSDVSSRRDKPPLVFGSSRTPQKPSSIHLLFAQNHSHTNRNMFSPTSASNFASKLSPTRVNYSPNQSFGLNNADQDPDFMMDEHFENLVEQIELDEFEMDRSQTFPRPFTKEVRPPNTANDSEFSDLWTDDLLARDGESDFQRMTENIFVEIPNEQSMIFLDGASNDESHSINIEETDLDALDNEDHMDIQNQSKSYRSELMRVDDDHETNFSKSSNDEKLSPEREIAIAAEYFSDIGFGHELNSNIDLKSNSEYKTEYLDKNNSKGSPDSGELIGSDISIDLGDEVHRLDLEQSSMQNIVKSEEVQDSYIEVPIQESKEYLELDRENRFLVNERIFLEKKIADMEKNIASLQSDHERKIQSLQHTEIEKRESLINHVQQLQTQLAESQANVQTISSIRSTLERERELDILSTKKTLLEAKEQQLLDLRREFSVELKRCEDSERKRWQEEVDSLQHRADELRRDLAREREEKLSLEQEFILERKKTSQFEGNSNWKLELAAAAEEIQRLFADDQSSLTDFKLDLPEDVVGAFQEMVRMAQKFGVQQKEKLFNTQNELKRINEYRDSYVHNEIESYRCSVESEHQKVIARIRNQYDIEIRSLKSNLKSQQNESVIDASKQEQIFQQSQLITTLQNQWDHERKSLRSQIESLETHIKTNQKSEKQLKNQYALQYDQAKQKMAKSIQVFEERLREAFGKQVEEITKEITEKFRLREISYKRKFVEHRDLIQNLRNKIDGQE